MNDIFDKKRGVRICMHVFCYPFILSPLKPKFVIHGKDGNNVSCFVLGKY